MDLTYGHCYILKQLKMLRGPNWKGMAASQAVAFQVLKTCREILAQVRDKDTVLQAADPRRPGPLQYFQIVLKWWLH